MKPINYNIKKIYSKDWPFVHTVYIKRNKWCRYSKRLFIIKKIA